MEKPEAGIKTCIFEPLKMSEATNHCCLISNIKPYQKHYKYYAIYNKMTGPLTDADAMPTFPIYITKHFLPMCIYFPTCFHPEAH